MHRPARAKGGSVHTTVPNSSTPILTERALDRAISRWNQARATGARIQSAREWAGISRAELAEFVGMSDRTLARVESGERALAPAERASVARGLGVSLAFLAVGSTNGNRRAA